MTHSYLRCTCLTSPNTSFSAFTDGLIPHQLVHEIGESAVRIHKLGLRTDETISALAHTAVETILEYPIKVVHPIGELCCEPEDTWVIASRRGDLGDDDGLIRVLCVHLLEERDGSIAVRAVVMESKVVWGIA